MPLDISLESQNPVGCVSLVVVTSRLHSCDRAGIDDFEQVRSAVGFLEMGLEIGDEYVRDLVSEALETLAACQHVPAVQPYFGPRLADLWRTIRQGI